jgi:hypothetical protein
MFFLTTSTYPNDKAKEIVTLFQKAVTVPLPSYLKRLYTLTTTAGDSGIKVVGLYEVNDDKVGEAYKELVKYFVQFYVIQGFRYMIEPMLTAQEAIPLLK